MIQASTGGGADAGKGEKDAENGEAKNEYEEGFKYAEESELGRDKSIKQSMRLREDTAKYLLNLDSDSAKYNPKKRALVDAGAINDKSAALFAEESFLRASGEAAEFEKAQRYAWEAQEKAGDTSLHLQANPTAGAVMRKKEVEERETKRQKRAEMLASQYGVQPTVSEALKAVTITENEAFVEYDEAGLIKVNPLASWSFKQVQSYVTEHNVPYNDLLDRGYKSVGDWHSTEPVKEGEDERAGRWKGQQKTECGIHNKRSKYAIFLQEQEQKRQQEELAEKLAQVESSGQHVEEILV